MSTIVGFANESAKQNAISSGRITAAAASKLPVESSSSTKVQASATPVQQISSTSKSTVAPKTAVFGGRYTYNVDAQGNPYGSPVSDSGTATSTPATQQATSQATPKITQTSTTPASTVAPTTPATGMPVQTGAPSSAYQAPNQDQQLQNLMSSKLSDTTKAQVAKNLGIDENYKVALAKLQQTGTTTNNGGEAARMIQEAKQDSGTPVDEEQVDVITANDKAIAKYQQDFQDSISTARQGESLVSIYQDMIKDSGLNSLNTEMMNLKRIIDGNEDMIRDEITKAGGFATDGQVLAMTNARNKQNIINYNTLVQTRSDMISQINTMMGLAEKDKEYAIQQVDRQLDYDRQVMQMTSKAVTDAKSSLENSIANYGAQAVYQSALASGDKTAVARINKIMGNGFDIATLASQPNLKEQLLSEQIKTEQAQRANIYSQIQERQAVATPTVTSMTTAEGKPLTQAQSAALGYGSRTLQAGQVIDSLQQQFASRPRLATNLPLVGDIVPNWMKSADAQNLEQAQRNFVNAVLRRESGAAISPSEFENAAKQYFPVWGDSSSTLAQKKANRDLVIKNILREGGQDVSDVSTLVLSPTGDLVQITN